MSGALYYALGGGLGHLTRARAVLAALGETARVLSVTDRTPVQGLDLLPVPPSVRADPAMFRPWLHGLLWRMRPHTLYLDCFPAGLFGELCGMPLPPGLRIVHLARLLRWEQYRPLLDGAAPRLHRTWRLEPLHGAHERWLRSHSDELSDMALDSPSEPPAVDPALLHRLEALGWPLWLVVHSGPEEEVRELLDYAREMAAAEVINPAVALIAPRPLENLPPGVTWFRVYPARGLFPRADRIVTACGFNLVAETAPFRAIHRFLPMPRRFDDQFARAARLRDPSAGRRTPPSPPPPRPGSSGTW